jgi:chromosome segregation ATPase
MENKQTTQMVSWLDEERRKDKALIIKLEERVSAQTALVDEQNRRIQTLEGELAAQRTNILSVSLFDESISRLRTDMNGLFEQAQQRVTPEQEIKKIREAARENTAKAIEDLRQEVMTRIEREAQPRRAEEERLSRIAVELQNYADNLSKGLEEFQRSLTYLEEQRRQDSRRLSDVHSEASEIGKRIESQQTKSELLEEISRRNERSLTELTGTVMELKQQRQTWTEQETLAEQRREKLLTDALRRLEDNLQTLSKQSEAWIATHRTMKKQVDDFDRLADRVDRKLNEVAEMQRLSEERFRHEWEEFQQEDQKRFRQFTLTNEEAWRGNEKFVKSVTEQLASLAEQSGQVVSQIRVLDVMQRESVEGMLNYLQGLLAQMDDKSKSVS